MTKDRSAQHAHVIVEMGVLKVDRAARVAHIAAPLVRAGLEVAEPFGAPYVPSLPALARDLAASNLEAIILRGVISLDRITALEATPGVIAVWRDGPIPQLSLLSSDCLRNAPTP